MTHQLPQLYTKHLQKHFSYTQYLLLVILIHLLQEIQTVKLEELARRFPYPILLRSRIKKLQRVLSLPNFKIETLWLPMLLTWVKQRWQAGKALHIVIDRSQWRTINLLMVSIVYRRRAIPLYFTLLEKKGNSNLKEQKQVLLPALNLLKDYQVIVFC